MPDPALGPERARQRLSRTLSCGSPRVASLFAMLLPQRVVSAEAKPHLFQGIQALDESKASSRKSGENARAP